MSSTLWLEILYGHFSVAGFQVEITAIVYGEVNVFSEL